LNKTAERGSFTRSQSTRKTGGFDAHRQMPPAQRKVNFCLITACLHSNVNSFWSLSSSAGPQAVKELSHSLVSIPAKLFFCPCFLLCLGPQPLEVRLKVSSYQHIFDKLLKPFFFVSATSLRFFFDAKEMFSHDIVKNKFFSYRKNLGLGIFLK